MAQTNNKEIKAESTRRTKVETTYEYVPILGDILGYWRILEQDRMGERVELHISTQLNDYDRLYINGELIEIPKKKK